MSQTHSMPINNPTLHVTGIAGSLREASISRAVLISISELLPTGTDFSVLDIGEIPHYNEDLDGSHVPISVAKARTRLDATDITIIVTPEFNHGLPGVLKNTLDWISRPAMASSMRGMPVFFVTISPGALGGVRAQYQLRETIASMLCELIPIPEIAITFASEKVQNGRLIDTSTLNFISISLNKFLSSAESLRTNSPKKGNF
jgi:chromate reductase